MFALVLLGLDSHIVYAFGICVGIMKTIKRDFYLFALRLDLHWVLAFSENL